MENTVIYIIGYPGTGKLTIAKELVKQEDSLRLVDNHLINNPLFSLIETDGKTKLPPRIWDNTRKVWDAVFDTMIHISPKDASFVLTNALMDDCASDHLQYKNVADMAAQRGAVFLPVRLTCTLEELQRRIVQPERKERMKSVCPKGAAELFNRTEVLRPTSPNALDIDITNKKPEEVARAILKKAKSLRP